MSSHFGLEQVLKVEEKNSYFVLELVQIRMRIVVQRLLEHWGMNNHQQRGRKMGS